MKFLAFSLSLRQGSFNKKLINLAIKMLEQPDQAATSNYATKPNIEVLDLAAYAVPSYNEDLETQQGFPAPVLNFSAKLTEAAGLIIASPEYNYSYPGHFKNLFDWVSRIRPMPWQNKTALFLAASPAITGGERALWPLKVPFTGCGALVYPQVFTLASVHQAFTENGELVDPKLTQKLQILLGAFRKFTAALIPSQ